ncbi:hypothetical protein ACOMHN_026188 [Nucella lapillus]
MLQVGLLLLMLTESIVVLVRQTNHFRVTRALRPIFLIHSHYCKGMRRIARQILMSLPPIVDMIILLLFFMLIFSILGFYLFSQIPDDPYFKTIQDSFINLFVLLTTANYPDVMMPAYSVSRFYAFFFIVYLSLELYFLMNLLLAVVYDTFSNLEKTKLRALFLHKREACMHAFRLLVTMRDSQRLSLRHFVGMMRFFHPKKSRRDCYLMFKSLNQSGTGALNLEEFFNIYNVTDLQWSVKNDESLWSSNFRHPCNKIFKAIHWFVNWKYFDYFIYLVIAGNFLWILIETIQISVREIDVVSYNFTASWTSIVFVCIYSVEAILKIIGRGPKDYFTHGWDVFDFLVTVVSVVGVFGELFDDSFYFIMVLRPFRLLRLFKIKRRYRDVLGTLFVLFQRLMSLIVCIILVYYFFAIIGMEVFLDIDLTNCCKNTSVEIFYQFSANNSQHQGFYYLNNFDNLLVSGVTLFELTVVNNWFIIMDGYAFAFSEWTRIYFMLFYIVMMVVMNIVVAFVLESFMFRIQYRRQMEVEDIEADHGLLKEEVTLGESELQMCHVESSPLTGSFIAQPGESQAKYIFRGERIRSREDFSLRMYQDEVQNWAEEFNLLRLTSAESSDNELRERRASSNDSGLASSRSGP